MFSKVIRFTEKRTRDDAELEIELQEIASRHGFAPKVLAVEKHSDAFVVQMEKVSGMSLADWYTDNFAAVPPDDITKIREILMTLLKEEGIVYNDITGYNFMKEEGDHGRIFIVDFGDAKYLDQEDEEEQSGFLFDFVRGIKNEWNPDFA